MKCNKCGQALPNDSEFCQYCGAKVEIVNENTQIQEATKVCVKCGNTIDSTSGICKHCAENDRKWESFKSVVSGQSQDNKSTSTAPTIVYQTKKAPIIILSIIIVVLLGLYILETQKVLGWVEEYNKIEHQLELKENEVDKYASDAQKYDKIRDFMKEETANREKNSYRRFYITDKVVVIPNGGRTTLSLTAYIGSNVTYYYQISDTSIADVSWGNWVDGTRITVDVKAKKAGIATIEFTNDYNSEEFNVLIVIV